jgi:hypothetical protein
LEPETEGRRTRQRGSRVMRNRHAQRTRVLREVGAAQALFRRCNTVKYCIEIGDQLPGPLSEKKLS